jgi:hypothetical protein
LIRSVGLNLLLRWRSWRYCNRSWLEWIRSRVRSLCESRHRRWRGLDSVQETALWIVSLIGRILGVLWPCLCRRFPEIKPELILLAQIDSGNSLRHLGCGMPLLPLVLCMWIVERITNLGHTISAIGNVEGGVAFFHVLRQWFSIGRWPRSLGLVWVKFQNVLPLHFNAIAGCC